MSDAVGLQLAAHAGRWYDSDRAVVDDGAAARQVEQREALRTLGSQPCQRGERLPSLSWPSAPDVGERLAVKGGPIHEEQVNTVARGEVGDLSRGFGVIGLDKVLRPAAQLA